MDMVCERENEAIEVYPSEVRKLCSYCGPGTGGKRRFMCEVCYEAMLQARAIEEEAAKKERYKEMIRRWRQ